MASLTSLMAAMVTAPPKPADARKVVDKSPAVDDALESYVDMLNDATIDIDLPPLADYGDYNDGLEEGPEGEEFEEEDAGDEEEDELEEIEEGAVAKAKGRAIRSGNYSEFEDVILIRVWEAVSMDAVTGTDQTGKSYWQRIEATKDKIKRQGEAASLSLKIDVMVKSKEALLMKTLAAKKEMMEAKTKEKEAKWTTLREDAKRKDDIEERRALCHGGAHRGGECHYDDESGRHG
ncbi:hypothetical protein QYE76_014075 [Lolium multiflorum]|uniref:Uncharacterized protein n=1 Tax=Lolium multiflorum TaxID=4521 RepID=A0AAD8U479_LOLMU|nr:hypothetical protein QYE76_014075 [Lolium multiflorum]